MTGGHAWRYGREADGPDDVRKAGLVVGKLAWIESPSTMFDILVQADARFGTADAWRYYEAGAPKVTEEVIAQGLEEAKRWIKESVDLQLELVKKAGVHEPIHDVDEGGGGPGGPGGPLCRRPGTALGSRSQAGGSADHRAAA